MNKPFVAILMGSDSDLGTMQGCVDVLKSLDVPFDVRVTSAHRTPAATHAYVTKAEADGCAVFICAAGMAAHLAGAVAGLTTKPIIGVPIDAGPLQGMDALLATVQMPAGIPVATVAVGKAGAKNAAYLAAQMLGLSDADLAQRVKDERIANGEAVIAKNDGLMERLGA